MKALVVDDDATSRFFLQEILTPYGEVHSCVDGAEAVLAFQRSVDQGRPYELICLDIMMPAISGMEALQQIRQSEQSVNPSGIPQVKILMITALNDAKTVFCAYHGQCDGYLVKPFDKARLLDDLRSLALIA